MKAVLLSLIFSSVAGTCFAADSSSIEASRKALLLHTEDKIRDEVTARNAAIARCQISSKATLYAAVTSLTKSPVTVQDRLKRGDTIWAVEVRNQAASDLIPIPDGIYWVRAKDGAVFEMVPKP